MWHPRKHPMVSINFRHPDLTAIKMAYAEPASGTALMHADGGGVNERGGGGGAVWLLEYPF